MNNIEGLFTVVEQPDYSKKVLQEMKEKYKITDKDWSYMIFHFEQLNYCEGLDNDIQNNNSL